MNGQNKTVVKFGGIPSNPTYGKTLKEPGVDESVDLKEIAESCNIMPGSYKKMTHEEILKILEECK